jgi:hypothetical protein
MILSLITAIQTRVLASAYLPPPRQQADNVEDQPAPIVQRALFYIGEGPAVDEDGYAVLEGGVIDG